MLQFGVNKTTGSGLFNGIDIWSVIPADVKAHIARVTADGGTVPNQASMVSMVKKLIAANLWNNCVFFGLPLGGVKKDGNQFVSKVYDLKANADLLQGTGTAQPLYQTDGSLLYDGGDKLLSNNLLATNAINSRSSITVICWVNIITAGYQFIFDRYDAGATDAWFIAQYSDAKMRVMLLSANNVVMKNYNTVSNIGTGWKCLSFTYSTTGGLNLYINGVGQSVTKTTDNTNAPINDSISPVCIGGRFANASNMLLNGTKTALPQIYNSTLTAEEILWNYNNIRPEGV